MIEGFELLTVGNVTTVGLAISWICYMIIKDRDITNKLMRALDNNTAALQKLEERIIEYGTKR